MIQNIIDSFKLDLNVKHFGAKGDARKVDDGTANSTNQVSSLTAHFTPADIGKVIWATDTSGATAFPRRTIVDVVNETTVTISGPVLGNATGLHVVFGTVDTLAIQAAGLAADAISPKKTVYFPAGGYIFDDTLFVQSYATGSDTFAIAGAGANATVLFPTPDHKLSHGRVFNYSANARRGNISGLTIDGGSVTYAGSPVAAQATADAIWNDVIIKYIKGCSSLTLADASDTKFFGCRWDSAGYNGVLVSGGSSFYECYAGNCGYIALHINGGMASWRGGILDESGGPTICVDNGQLKIADALVYAGGNQPAIQVSAGSRMKAVNSDFIPYAQNNNVTGLRVGIGGQAYLTQCELRGSGTGFGLENNGTVYDGGNNLCNTKADPGIITTTAL